MSEPGPDIERVIPEIALISDEALRGSVRAVWARLLDQGSFRDLLSVPVSMSSPYPHVPHNRSVVNMALKVADVLEEFHGVKVDRNFLIAAALLQDVSKLVEFELTGDGAVEKSEIGERFQHGFWAAHAALEEQVPYEIVEAILDHTYEGPRFPRSLISKILFYVDQIDMAALGGDRWKKTGAIFR